MKFKEYLKEFSSEDASSPEPMGADTFAVTGVKPGAPTKVIQFKRKEDAKTFDAETPGVLAIDTVNGTLTVQPKYEQEIKEKFKKLFIIPKTSHTPTSKWTVQDQPLYTEIAG